MNRRNFLIGAGLGSLLRSSGVAIPLPAGATEGASERPFRRVRPGEPSWPSEGSWKRLNRDVRGQLVKVESPLTACAQEPNGVACAEVFKELKDPYYIGDNVGLTQTLGWVDGWISQPSTYAVAVGRTEDIVAAVNFARENRLRLVVKGGGHSYLGTSNAPDSLLVWTRNMKAITLHDAFVGKECDGTVAPQPAVTIEAGAMWMHVYDTVTTKAGRYVQGGGCATVGVAGLIQSGGFGSFSKAYGIASAALIEAEIVTADGAVRIVNPCTDPDLFWAIKGGGGGSFGVVSRLTLRTRELPEFFGGVNITIKASSDLAFRRLIGYAVSFYNEKLFNPAWGEQMVFQRENTLAVRMVFQGLTKEQVENVWRAFLDWLASSPQDFAIASGPNIASVPARHFWNPQVLKSVPGLVIADDRPGVPEANIFWAGDANQAGQFVHGYRSVWLPRSLLLQREQEHLADAIFAATRHWELALHFNKGLAGAASEAVEAAKDTAMNPAVLDAFALAIIAGQVQSTYPGIAGHEPNVAAARKRAQAIGDAMSEIKKLVTNAGSYLPESDFFENDWQHSYWGTNYPRLLAVKKRYDPEGLFFVHHGVGSEEWSADGFSKITG